MAREEKEEQEQRFQGSMSRAAEQARTYVSTVQTGQEEYETAKTEVTASETKQSLSNLGVTVPSFTTATSPYISENPANKTMTQTMQDAWLNMANPMEQALSYTFYNNFKYQLGLTPNDVKVSDMIDFTTYINETSSGTVYSFEDALQGYVAMQSQFGGTLEYYSPTKEVKLYHDYINMQTTYGGVSEEVAAQQYVDARNKALQWSNTLEKSVLGQVAMGGDFTSIITAVSPNFIDAVGASIASIANEGYDYDGMGVVDTNGLYLTGTETSGKEFLQTLTLAEQGNAMAQKEVKQLEREMNDYGTSVINMNGKLWDTSMMLVNGLSAASGTVVGRAELAIENIGEDAAVRQENIEEFQKNAKDDMAMLFNSMGYSYSGITEFMFQTDEQASTKAWVDDHLFVSLALEIGLDPTSWITLGVTTYFKSTTKSLKAISGVQKSTSDLNKATKNFRTFNAPGSEVKATDLEADIQKVEKMKADNAKKKATYEKRILKETEKNKKAMERYAKLFDLDPATMDSLFGEGTKVPPKKWYSKQGIRKRRACNKINQTQMTIKNYNLAIKNLDNLDMASETFLKFSVKIMDELKKTPGYNAEIEIKELTDEFDALEKQVKTLDEQFAAKEVAERNLGTIKMDLEKQIKEIGGLQTLENILEELTYANIDNLDISSDDKNQIKGLYNKLKKTNDQIDALRPEKAKIIEEKVKLSPKINENSVRLRQLLDMIKDRASYGDVKTYDVKTFAKMNDALVKNTMVNIGNQFFSATDFEQEFRKYVNQNYKGNKHKETREKLLKSDIEYKKEFIIDNWLKEADIHYGVDGEIYSAAKQELKHGYYDPANTDKLKAAVTKILKKKGYGKQKIDKAMGFIDMEISQLTPEEFLHASNSYHTKLSKNYDKGLQPTASFLNRTIIDDIDAFSDLLDKDVLLENGFVNYQDVLNFKPEYTKRLPRVAVQRFTDTTEALKNTLHNITSRAGRQITKMKNNNAKFSALHAQLKELGLTDEEIAMITTWKLDLLNEVMHNWSLDELEKRVFDPMDKQTSIISLNDEFLWWVDDFNKRINKNETLIEFYDRTNKKKPKDFAGMRFNEKTSKTGKFLTIELADYKAQRVATKTNNPEVYHALETEMKNSLDAFFKNYGIGEYVPFTKQDMNKVVDGVGVDGNYTMSLTDIVGTVFYKDILAAILESNTKIANRHATAIRREYNKTMQELVQTDIKNYKLNKVFDEEEFEYYKIEAINQFFSKTFINFQQMDNVAKGEVLKTIKRKTTRDIEDVLLGKGKGTPRLFNDPDLIKQVGIDKIQGSIYDEIDKIALEMARDASELGLKGIDFQQELINAINSSDAISKFYHNGSFNLQEDLSKVSMRSILRKMDKFVTPNITDDTIWWSDQFGLGLTGTDRQQDNLLKKMMSEYGISKEAAQELLHNRFGFYRIYNQKSTGREVHASQLQPDLRHKEFVGVPHIKKVRSFVKQKEDITVDNQEDLNAIFDITDDEVFNAHVLKSEDFEKMELLETLKNTQYKISKKVDTAVKQIDDFEKQRLEKYENDVEAARIKDIQAQNNVNSLKNKLTTKVINEIGEKDISNIIDEFLKVDAKQYIKDNKAKLSEELQDSEVFKELYNPDSKNMAVHLNSVLNKTLRFEFSEYLSKVGTKKKKLPAIKREYEQVEVEIPNAFDEITETVTEQIGEEFDKIKIYSELTGDQKYMAVIDLLKQERLDVLETLGEKGTYEKKIGDSEFTIEISERTLGSDTEPTTVVGIKGPQERELLKIPEPLEMKNQITDYIFGKTGVYEGISEGYDRFDNDAQRGEALEHIFGKYELDESGFFVKDMPETQDRLTKEQLTQIANSYTNDELHALPVAKELGVKKSWTKKKTVDEIVRWFENEDLEQQFDAFDNDSRFTPLSTLYEKLDKLGIYNINITPFVNKIGTFDSRKFVYEPKIATYSKENLDKFLDMKLQMGELDGDTWRRFVKENPDAEETELKEVIVGISSRDADEIISKYFDELVMQGDITPSETQRITQQLTGEETFAPREEKLTVEEERKLASSITDEIINNARPEKMVERFNFTQNRSDEILKLAEKFNWEDELSTLQDDELFDKQEEAREDLEAFQESLDKETDPKEKAEFSKLVDESQQEVDFIQERFDFNELTPDEQNELRREFRQNLEDNIFEFIHNGGKNNTTSKTLEEQFRIFKGKEQEFIDETLQQADIALGETIPKTVSTIEEVVGEVIPHGPGRPIYGEVKKTIQVPKMETKFQDIETGELFDEKPKPQPQYETVVDTSKLKEIPFKEAQTVEIKGDTKTIRNTREALVQNREMLDQITAEITTLQNELKETVDESLIEAIERIDYLNFKQGELQDDISGLEAIEAEKQIESEEIRTIETPQGPQQVTVKAPKSTQIFSHSVNNEELNIIKSGMQEILNIVEGLKPLEDLVTSESFKTKTTSKEKQLTRQAQVNEYAAGLQQISRVYKQDIEPYIDKKAINPELDTDFYKKQIESIDAEIQKRAKEFEESYTGISDELDASFIDRAMKNDDFDYTSEINDAYQILQLVEREKITDQELRRALYPETLDPSRFSGNAMVNEEFSRRMSEVVARTESIRTVGITNFKQMKEEYKEPENKKTRLEALKAKQTNGEELSESDLEFLFEVETFEKIQQMISNGTIDDVFVLDFSSFKDDPVALEAAKNNMKKIIDKAYVDEYEKAQKYSTKIPIMKGDVYKENLTKMEEIISGIRDRIGRENYKAFADSWDTIAHELSISGYDMMIDVMGADMAQKSSLGQMEGTYGSSRRNKATADRSNLLALMNGAVDRTNSNPNIRIGHVKTYEYLDHIRKETGKAQTVSGPERRPVDMLEPLSTAERSRIAKEVNNKVNATKVIQVPKRKKAQDTLKEVPQEMVDKTVLVDEGAYVNKLVDELASRGIQDLAREDRMAIIKEATRMGGKDYKRKKLDEIDRRLGRIYDNSRASEEIMFYNQMSFTERNAKGPLHILNQEAEEHVKKRNVFGKKTNKSIKMFEDNPNEYLNRYGFMQTQDTISESLIMKLPDFIKGFDNTPMMNYIEDYKPRNNKPWSKERRNDNSMVKVSVREILDNDRGLLGTFTREQKLALREALEDLKDKRYKHGGNLDNLSILIDRKDFNLLQNQINAFGRTNNTNAILRGFSHATRLLKGSALWGGFKTKFALSVPLMTGFLEGQSLSKTMRDLKKFTHNNEKIHDWLKNDISKYDIIKELEGMEFDKAFEYIKTHGDLSDSEKNMLESFVFESGARSFSRNLKDKYIDVNGKRAKSIRMGDNKPKSDLIDHVTKFGSNVPVMKHLVANFDPMEAGAIVRAKTLFEDTALLERKVREFGLGDADLNDANQRMAASIRIAEDELGIGESDTLSQTGWRGGINKMVLFPGFIMRAFPKMMMNYFGTPSQLGRMGGLLILFDNFKYAAGYNQYQINSMTAKERTALNFRLPGTSEDGSLQINLFSPLDVLNTFGDIKQATSVSQWLINITNPILLAPLEMYTGEEVDSYGKALQQAGYSPLDAIHEAEGAEKIAPAMQYLFTMMTGNIGKIFTQTRNLLSGQDDFGNYYVQPGASDYAINVVNAFAKKFGLNPYERVTIDDIPVLSSIFNYQEDPQGIDTAKDIWYDVVQDDVENYKKTIEGTKEGEAVAEKISKFEKRSQAAYVLDQMSKAKQDIEDNEKSMPETLRAGATRANLEENQISNADMLKAKSKSAKQELERKLAYIKAHD